MVVDRDWQNSSQPTLLIQMAEPEIIESLEAADDSHTTHVIP